MQFEIFVFTIDVYMSFKVVHAPTISFKLYFSLLTYILFFPWHFHFIFLTSMNVCTVVSQVEHGVLHLVKANNPQITVLVDCDGLSPLRIPMQIMRSCSSLLQDHYPNRLGCLLVIRLPPVVRVITQTFIQVKLITLIRN